MGSYPHFDMEIFSRRAGAEMLHIPNKTGAAGMINDLVVGDAQVAFLNAVSSAPMIRAGKLRPLAVLAEQRLPDYPDVPTLAEAGYAGVGTLHWQSMLAPANTPKEVLATLFKAIGEAANAPQLQDNFKKQFVTVKLNRLIGRVASLAQGRARRLAQDRRRGQDRAHRLATRGSKQYRPPPPTPPHKGRNIAFGRQPSRFAAATIFPLSFRPSDPGVARGARAGIQ